MSRQASNICRSFRPGFTLIEVVVATAVLVTISAGVLMTTWRMASFARDKAEYVSATAFSQDLLWALYKLDYAKYDEIKKDGMFGTKENPIYISSNALPSVVVHNFSGERRMRPLWRDAANDKNPKHQPCYWVDINEATDKDVKSTCISVTIQWWSTDERNFKTNCMSVVRVK